MSCEETRHALQTLATREFAALDHLASCPACRALADAIIDEEQQMHATIDAWVQQAPPRARRSPWRYALPAALALAAAAALWLVVQGGPPPETTPRSLSVPVAPVKPPADTLDLAAGLGLVLTTPRPIASVRVDDTTVAGAARLGTEGNRVHLFGIAEGQTVLTVTFRDGEPNRYAVTVGPRKTEAPGDNVLAIAVGETQTITPNRPADAVVTSDPSTLAVRDAAGAAVTIEGLRPGITDLVIAFPGTPPQVYQVNVTP
ncbi:MAG: pilus assembly protein N-terminal domain-containing protein [Myxococcota bacterium]